MNELSRAIRDFLKELSEKISEGKEFEFWKELEKAEKAMESVEELSEGVIEDGVVLDNEAIVFVGNDTVIKNGTRIEGKVFIGENCTIGPNAFLRNGTIIADNCHIGTSEVKNSIILSNSNVPHFSYVGDSVVGENVNLGAGTTTGNLRFDNANVKVEVNGKVIDSGRRKLGALIGHGVKTGIHASIYGGRILGNNSRVYPGRIVEKNIKKGGIFK